VRVQSWSRRRAWLTFLATILVAVALQWLLGWLVWPALIENPWVRYPTSFVTGALLGSGAALLGLQLCKRSRT